MSDFKASMELNCEGLNCPLPILKTKKAIDSLSSGEILKITTTDPGSVSDMASWAQRTGNELLAQSEGGGVHAFFIKKSNPD